MFFIDELKKCARSIRSKVVKGRLEKQLEGIGPNSFIILSVPEHGNLGDQAILEGELAFLSHYFPDRSVSTISGYEWMRADGVDLSSCLPDGASVLFQGGGFLGTLWPAEEEALLQAAGSHGGRPAVVMPQTCWYSDDAYGRELLEKRKVFYAGHPEISLMLRDRRSYELCIHEFPANRPEYVPDMAMFLEPGLPPRERRGALLCLRGDLERTLDDSATASIERVCRDLGMEPRRTDTVVAVDRVDDSNRRALLDAKLSEFASADLCVTDRLHGMVMAAITRTPVVALDNVSGKVSGVGKWISELPYVKFAKPGDDVAALAREAIAADPSACPSTRELLSADFDRLAGLLSERLGL